MSQNNQNSVECLPDTTEFYDTSELTEHTNESIDMNESISLKVRENSLNKLSDLLLKNIVHYYGKSSTPISDASDISEMLTDSVKKTIDYFKSFIKDCNSLEEVQKIAQNVELDDENFRSTYMIKKHLEDRNLLFKPQTFTIENECIVQLNDLDAGIDTITYQGIVMPIQEQIKTFLELSGILEAIFESQEQYSLREVDNQTISHFCQGNLWKTIRAKYDGKNIIPIMIYNDEFNIDNAVGPHSSDNGISAFYYQFPSFPNHLKSKVKYIFVAIALSKYIKNNSDSALWMLVHIFKDLEINGIDILNKNGETIKVHIILTNMQGDNLGIHMICGFTTGFNSSFYCRFCLTPKDICKILCDSSNMDLRTVDK